ncbi:cell division protein ZapA [Alicyclobacillus herbarius]|uniref:cell division protein ZapA n=1 Tax=Alicyclobacillus herbarius TaxID=122960 RepID=UPI00041FBDF1|nr:cell division protein ZapA [Alicyclobacillus herbarius]
MAKEEEVNRARVFILGTEYTLRGNASVAHLRQVADKVDAVMEQVAKANPQLESRRVAVLAAINLADELIRLQNEYQELLELLEEQTAAATRESEHPGRDS